MNRPTDQLIEEHRRIETLLDVLIGLAAQADAGAPNLDLIERAITTVRVLADEAHHGKEEQVLFPALIEAGFPERSGPVACMLQEHEVGRLEVNAMEMALEDMRAGKDRAPAQFSLAVSSFAAMLRDHIMKEDEVLFPMAEQHLCEETKRKVTEGFASVQADDIGEERYAALLRTVDELAAEVLARPSS